MSATPRCDLRPAESIGDTLASLCRALTAAGIEPARLEARLLLAAAMEMPADALFGRSRDRLDEPAGARLDALLRRRLDGEPMAYILGQREFWSLLFVVGPAVLVPRPDSETLIEAALGWLPQHQGASLRVLDLGTGSGCLLLSLLHERPDATGVGVDISTGALAIARLNAERLRMAERASFIAGDWAGAIDDRFDLILCNPPYVAESELAVLPPSILGYEPHLALAAGADGLSAYRRICPDIARLLRPGGRAVFELGCGQGPAVTALAAENGLQTIDLQCDLAAQPRALQVGARADGRR